MPQQVIQAGTISKAGHVQADQDKSFYVKTKKGQKKIKTVFILLCQDMMLIKHLREIVEIFYQSLEILPTFCVPIGNRFLQDF